MDSETVEADLESFTKELFGAKPVETAEAEEVSENTPSATNESEESETPENEVEDDGEDTAAEQDDEQKEEADKPKSKRRRNAQDRIDELTQDKYELRRRITELEKITVKSQEKSEDTPAQVATVKDAAPTPDAAKEDGTPLYPLGEFDPQYIADLTRFTIRQENEAMKKQTEEESRQQKLAAAQQELTKSWEQKVTAAAERLPDLPQKFGVLQDAFHDIPQEQGNFIASSIMSLENGPDVLSYFADNLDEAKLLMKGGVFETIIALGRLDGEFSARNKGVEKGVAHPRATQAPPPPPANTKGSTNVKTLDPESNLEDFETLFFKK